MYSLDSSSYRFLDVGEVCVVVGFSLVPAKSVM